MRTLPTSLDLARYNIILPEGVNADTHLLDNLIALVHTAHERGLGVKEQRLLFGIVGKFEEAIKFAREVEVTEDEFSFLRNAIRDARAPAAAFRLANALYDLFEVS